MRFPWVEHLNLCWCSCISVQFEHMGAPSGVCHGTQLQPKPHAVLFSSDNTTLEDTTLSCAVGTCFCYSSMGSETLVFLCSVMLIHCVALNTVNPDTGATPTNHPNSQLPAKKHTLHCKHTLEVECSAYTCDS